LTGNIVAADPDMAEHFKVSFMSIARSRAFAGKRPAGRTV
jgi:hypothetical protein